jgi:hypothetical protein
MLVPVSEVNNQPKEGSRNSWGEGCFLSNYLQSTLLCYCQDYANVHTSPHTCTPFTIVRLREHGEQDTDTEKHSKLYSMSKTSIHRMLKTQDRS